MKINVTLPIAEYNRLLEVESKFNNELEICVQNIIEHHEAILCKESNELKKDYHRAKEKFINEKHVQAKNDLPLQERIFNLEQELKIAYQNVADHAKYSYEACESLSKIPTWVKRCFKVYQ